jgi:signal transduction histidine kinase
MCVEGILRETSAPGRLDVAGIADSASTAREQVLRCRAVTQNFLRLSRGQATAGEIVELARAVDGAVRLVTPAARSAGVLVEVEPVDPAFRVRADEGELQHALINVLMNAVQACGGDGSGHVRVSADGPDPVRVHVSDDGCGIAPEYRQRIFEPFFGLRKGGTGLGLFLALNFVRRWGGEITVASEPGRGSTFDIVVPALAGSSVPEVGVEG